jgi:hypothetical protein
MRFYETIAYSALYILFYTFYLRAAGKMDTQYARKAVGNWK